MSRRDKNIAGLAALGALGLYMARGDKKSAGEAVPVPEEAGTMPRVSGVGMEKSSAESEYVGRPGQRINTEHGDLYTPLGADQPTNLRQRPVVATPGGSVASAAAPAIAPLIVNKEELAKSGLSLRDFLNKERGLTRRVEREPASISSRKPNMIYDAEGQEVRPLKKGGAVKMASGGSTSSASRRGDGIAQRGKTRGRMR